MPPQRGLWQCAPSRRRHLRARFEVIMAIMLNDIPHVLHGQSHAGVTREEVLLHVDQALGISVARLDSPMTH